MLKGLLYLLGFVSLVASSANAAEPAMALQTAQPVTDPGAFLLIGFGLLAIGAVGIRKYKN